VDADNQQNLQKTSLCGVYAKRFYLLLFSLSLRTLLHLHYKFCFFSSTLYSCRQ